MVRELENTELAASECPDLECFDADYAVLDKKDFYKELRLRGYHYQQLFQGIEKAGCNGRQAIIKWNDNWPAFIDAMLQVSDVQVKACYMRIVSAYN